MTTQTPPGAAPPGSGDSADQAAPLDALLADAALGTFRRFTPDASAAKFAAGLARRPHTARRQKLLYRSCKPSGLVKTRSSALSATRCLRRSGAMRSGKAATRRPALDWGDPNEWPLPRG